MQNDDGPTGLDGGQNNVDVMAVAQQWADLIDVLVPPQTVEVEDITGTVHSLRANLPAAVEVRILRKLRVMGSAMPDLAALADPEGDITGQATTVVDAVIALCSDEAVLSCVAECFGMAHPRAVREAVVNVAADENLAEYMPATGTPGPADLFSAVDLVSGIVPFGLRAVSKTGKLAANLLPLKNSKAS